MAETEHALGQILLQALPTFFLVIVLYLYLDRMFFRPFAKVLAQRRAMTEGAREAAKVSLDRAAENAQKYEMALRAERAEVYKQQEEERRKWREEQAAQIREARKSADQIVAAAKADLRKQAEEAKQSLAASSQSLADDIVRMVLDGRPA